MTEEGAMDLHEYAEDVALDGIRDRLHGAESDASVMPLSALERAMVHAVADAVLHTEEAT